MTDGKQLFDKSRDEMKWRFVRERFYSGNVFGKAEIEEWLEWQRKQANPAAGDLAHWKSLSYRVSDYAAATHQDGNAIAFNPNSLLHSCATVCAPDTFTPATEFAPFFRALCDCLKERLEIRIYRDCNDELFMLVFEGENYRPCYKWRRRNEQLFELAPFMQTPHAIFAAVYAILLDEWRKHRPRWEAAREYLCNILGECVGRERVKAESDFERAVAVSSDGKSIVCCDEVVVIDGMKAIFFPAVAFAKNKILENPAKHRFSYDYPMSEKSLREWLTHIVVCNGLEKTGQGQFFSTLSSFQARAKDKDRFVTDIRYCPDPLPEGGVVVQLS